MIRVICAQCQTSFNAKDESAGKRAKCPKCHRLLQVPGVSTSGNTSADRDQAILAAFQGPIESVRVPITYLLGILLVAVVMVVLPLLYVALIGLVGWLIYLHAIHDTFILNAGGSGRARGMALLVYLAPMVAGAILALFMIKPLFARPARESTRRSLSREKEPLLFAFVERICATVGAPMPKRIDIDTEVNASASFRRGWWSMLVGNDLVLTLGLPLVAGLTLRQFAGVLAHEFGHFSQGAGMRLTYIIRSISYWFTRVVYERDEWDQRLTEWSQAADARISLILHLARFFVWLTRRILWVLMLIGHAVSGFMLRQMEFDADRYEARLAGSDTFESTCRRLLVLNVATQGAHADLGAFFKEGRLGDNLPKLMIHNISQIPAEVFAALNAAIDDSTSGWLDTHPADKDRIANARRENAPGVFRLEEPASVLFSDFAGLSVDATLDFYQTVFGPQLQAVQVQPLDTLLVRQDQEKEADKALRRYFQDHVSLLRPLQLPSTWIVAPSDREASLARLKAARQEMLGGLKDYAQPWADYQKADDLLLDVERADALLRADLKVPEKEFSVSLRDCIAVRRVREGAVADQQKAEAILLGFERAAGQRLHAALELLHDPQLATQFEETTHWQEELMKLLPALALLIRETPSILELRKSHLGLVTLASNLESHSQKESLISALRKQMGEVYGQVIKLHREFGAVAYPFDHAKGAISLGDYLLKSLPVEDDLGAIYEASREVLATAHGLYSRLLGRLALIAEQVESLVGLDPLPEPTDQSPTGDVSKEQ